MQSIQSIVERESEQFRANEIKRFEDIDKHVENFSIELANECKLLATRFSNSPYSGSRHYWSNQYQPSERELIILAMLYDLEPSVIIEDVRKHTDGYGDTGVEIYVKFDMSFKDKNLWKEYCAQNK